MSLLSKEDRIQFFMSFFKGRSDVFAQRWEKFDGSASGYVPVYTDKTKTQYAPLTKSVIEEHLLGKRVIGMYPLLQDNTSWLVAADFDGDRWIEQAKSVFKYCADASIPCCIERSRSGKGGHIWWFFHERYPAYKGRKIFLHVLKESGAIGLFDTEDSFDRLFPSQDYLSGKGLGNLIALPLQGIPRKSGNSIFLDPTRNFEPANDQWELLQSVTRMPIHTLDSLYESFTAKKVAKQESVVNYTGSEIPITISNFLSIPKSFITKDIANFLTAHLNFFNAEYAVKEKMGLSVYKTERYFKTIIDSDADVFLPRGFLDQLRRYFENNIIPYTLVDQRTKCEPVELKPTFTLHTYQQEAVDALIQHDQGILVAPPGSGKTIMALALISQRSQPALILVHRNLIYAQWCERIESFLSIPKRNIGQIIGSNKEVQIPVTVGMIQSLARMKNVPDIGSQFGLVLVDECHHVPARMFRKVITQYNPYYFYGLTATPVRKHNDEKLIFIYLGDIIHQVPKGFAQSENAEQQSQIQVVVRNTDLLFPHKVRSRDYQILTKVLTFDTRRNQLITGDISAEAKAGKNCLVITERKEHIEILSEYLKQEFELIVLSGDLTPKKRQERIAQIQDGHYQIILATGQLIGEGTHFQNLDCLFLVFPFSFEGKLVQYLGRLLHSKGIKMVYDYRDGKIEYLEKMFKKRKKFYERLASANP
ncbi:MAG: TOTE conflict system archaeo-eukaryotic primase domain-containing protein [bacterium]